MVKRTAPRAAQIGHNGGPDMTAAQMLEMIGPKPDTALKPFQCGAPWTGHATDKELKRLARLQRRIELKEQALRELTAERRLIMNRCIRRMRREDGKN